MTAARLALAAIGLILVLLSVWAWANQGGLHGSVLQQLLVVWTVPWGASAMLHLHVSFAITIILIVYAEASWRAGLLFALPVLLLGHGWTALWLALRLPRIAAALNR